MHRVRPAVLAIALAAGIATASADDPRHRHGRADRHGPGIVIAPEIVLPAREAGPEASPADEIMADLGRCLANGTTRFMPCLRGRATSVTIRRLEVCVQSEFIPADATEVRACLAAGRW